MGSTYYAWASELVRTSSEVSHKKIGPADDLSSRKKWDVLQALSPEWNVNLNDSDRVINPGVGFSESMLAVLENVTEASIQRWLDTDNLTHRSSMAVEWFELTLWIDGWEIGGREVSLVSIKRDGEYPQHMHRYSDALFVAREWQAYLLSWREERLINPGDVVRVPRGMLHGFRLIPMQDSWLTEGAMGFAPFSFVSIQYPPIRKTLPDGTYQDDLEFASMEQAGGNPWLNVFT